MDSNKPNVHFQIKLAGYHFDISCFNDSTKRYCHDFLSEGDPDFKIILTNEDIEEEKENAKDGHLYGNAELTALYRKIADTIIEKDVIVFHSSAISIDGKGYLIAARSGVGKSTHAKYLQEALGERFHYINDDKPLIKKEEDGFLVYSSPWNGKERRGEDLSAPLCGILFLDRGEIPSCEKIQDPQTIYFRLLSQIYLPYDKGKKEKALKIADAIFKEIPFYQIKATLDISSAYKTIERITQHEA